jgi:hypothetical protein
MSGGWDLRRLAFRPCLGRCSLRLGVSFTRRPAAAREQGSSQHANH